MASDGEKEKALDRNTMEIPRACSKNKGWIVR
jgi:hypothetical protein